MFLDRQDTQIRVPGGGRLTLRPSRKHTTASIRGGRGEQSRL